MKKHLLLLSLLATALTLTLTSCSDNDDDELSEEQKEQQAYEQQVAVNSSENVLSQLTSDDLGDNWMDGTYTPTIGQAENNNEAVRVISTGDLETAAQRFCDLIGIAADGFDADKDYTYTDERIGTLVWHKDGIKALATVSADIKQLPQLSQIVYKTPEQIGANGTFNGTAYYRFGDVVRKLNSDGNGWDYWVCVRPAFGTVEGKEESHWITLSPLPSKNTSMTTKKSGGNTTHFQVPKGLTTKTEHLQNLAEMAYAMTHSDQWAKNLKNNGYKTLKYFHDFHYDKTFRYNGDLFFGNVGWAWKQVQVDGKDLYNTIFRLDADAFAKTLDDFGLRFMYGDASFSSDATVNFPTLTYKGTNLKSTEKGKYAVYSPGQDYYITQAYTANDKFPADMAYSLYLPRYATGADLCKGAAKGSYDVYSPLANCEDVYVYNKLFGILNDKAGLKNLEPEVLYTPTNGDGYYQIGDVVIDEEGSRWFCLLGSPFNSPIEGIHQDHNAYFFSLEGIKLSDNGKTATNIVTSEELKDLVFFFSYHLSVLSDYPEDYKYSAVSNPGAQFIHLRDYADVDISRLFVVRDSTWTFYKASTKQTLESKSTSRFYNVAYNDGDNSAQAIARVVYDYTQAGTQRTATPDPRYKNSIVRAYKHYFDTSWTPVRMPDASEQSMGLTPWHMPWAVSDQRITLQDVADAGTVAVQSWNDKWVTLPWSLKDEWVAEQERGKMRTVIETSADPADYLWNPRTRDFATPKTHMYNEPVLFIRMMKVNDPGRFPTLQSADGKVKFSILHHQNSERAYMLGVGRLWGNAYEAVRENLLEIDNEVIEFPKLEGWIE